MTEIIIVTRRERQTHFEGACPECGSVMIDELPTVNLTRKYWCRNCDVMFGVMRDKLLPGRIRRVTQWLQGV